MHATTSCRTLGVGNDPSTATAAQSGLAVATLQPGIDPAHILASLPAAMVVIDAEGIVTMANETARHLLGAAVVGQRWHSVIERAVVSEDGHSVRLRSGRVVEVTTQPQSDGIGQIVLLVDVTPGRLAEDFNRHHDHLASLGQMSAAIAHQIRTPLTTARLQLAALSRTCPQDAAVSCRLDELHQTHERLERLIDDMLVFARGGELPMDEIGLDDFIDGFADAVAPLCEQAAIGLRIERDYMDAHLWANEEALIGALRNLVDNALHALSECPPDAGKAEVEVRFCRRRLAHGIESLEIRVTDNGPGIAAPHRQRLFEPFYTTRASGTGLGLAVARAVCESHRGTIAYVERSRGACFAIHLPLLRPSALASGGRCR